MLEIGKFNRLLVCKEVPFGLYLESEEGEILMPKRYVAEGTQIGDWVEVFIYHDSEDRLVAVTTVPMAQRDEFVCLEVKQTTDFGAFMDWGLTKDLFVPKKEQRYPMVEGQKQVVRICLDPRTNRLIGISKIFPFLEQQNIELEERQEVQLMVFDETDIGISCLINEKYVGILYRNEVFRHLRMGEKTIGYIKKIREDNKIDLSLRRQGFEKVMGEAAFILQKLKENGGFLPFSDNSSPDEIKDTFQMSKKMFKKLIGNLFKEQKIEILEEGIKLKK